MSAFDRALAYTLGPDVEGGISNNPLDRGGLTANGFTQRTYDTYRLTTGKPKRSVELIEDDEKTAIARDLFWASCNCDLLPDDLALAVFDMAFNSGPWNAKLTLQRAVRVRADGVIGPATVAAVKATPDVALRFLEKRMAYIQDVISTAPSQVAFLEGWGKRLLRQAWMLKGTP